MRLARRAWLSLFVLLPLAAARAEAPDETLTIALSAPLVTLDPAQAVTVNTDLSIISDLYSPLLTRGPDLQLHGVLATDWHAEGDTTWVFHLRPGVSFPDGEPLDAAAVKWNIDRILAPQTDSRARVWYAPIKEVQAPGPTELRVITSAPFPALPAQFSMLFLLAPHWTATHQPAVEAMGTGPYDLVSYAPGDRLVLRAKPSADPKPDFDTVVVRSVTDTAARIAGLLAGELDVITDIPPSEIARINASGHAHAAASDTARAMMIKINTDKPPFKGNVALRQALNYAVDKQSIVDSLYDGQATLSQCQVLSKFYTGFNPTLKPYPFDPAKARALVGQSGVPTPIHVELEVPVGRYLLAEDTSQVIAAQLQDVGFDVAIHQMDFAAWMQKYGPARDMGQLAILTQGWPTLDADGFLSLYDPANPAGYWNDPDFTTLIHQGRASMDPAQRETIYRQATARMCEQAPVIFLFNPKATYATSARVSWRARPDDWLRAFDVHRAAEAVR
jgi:peptide/nickel transport system substrate-binding protein